MRNYLQISVSLLALPFVLLLAAYAATMSHAIIYDEEGMPILLDDEEDDE